MTVLARMCACSSGGMEGSSQFMPSVTGRKNVCTQME